MYFFVVSTHGTHVTQHIIADLCKPRYHSVSLILVINIIKISYFLTKFRLTFKEMICFSDPLKQLNYSFVIKTVLNISCTIPKYAIQHYVLVSNSNSSVCKKTEGTSINVILKSLCGYGLCYFIFHPKFLPAC